MYVFKSPSCTLLVKAIQHQCTQKFQINETKDKLCLRLIKKIEDMAVPENPFANEFLDSFSVF